MKNRHSKTIFLLGLATLAGLMTGAQDAIAQYAGSMGSMYNTISFASQSISISQNAYYDTIHRGQKLSSGQASSSNTTPRAGSNTGTAYQPPPPPRQFPITATDFTPSPNRIVPDQLVNGMPNLTNEQKETLRNAYLQTLTFYETKIRKNNLANSFATIVATSQQIVDKQPLSGEQIGSLINYYNNILASTPQIINNPDEQKQILNESLILTAASMDALNTQGMMQNNPEAQKQARDMAKSYLKKLAGIDVE